MNNFFDCESPKCYGYSVLVSVSKNIYNLLCLVYVYFAKGMIIKILAIVFYDLYIKTCPKFHLPPDLVKSGLFISNHYPCHYHQNHFRTRQPDMRFSAIKILLKKISFFKNYG